MKIFVAPHNDDEVLFGAFTLQREHPVVYVVTDSFRQEHIDPIERRLESKMAAEILGVEIAFLGFPDNNIPDDWFRWLPLDDTEHIYLPAWESDGNRDHNHIANWQPPSATRVTRYMTYTTQGKSRGEYEVPYTPEMLLLKLRALTCFESQILERSCTEHFIRSQREWYRDAFITEATCA